MVDVDRAAQVKVGPDGKLVVNLYELMVEKLAYRGRRSRSTYGGNYGGRKSFRMAKDVSMPLNLKANLVVSEVDKYVYHLLT